MGVKQQSNLFCGKPLYSNKRQNVIGISFTKKVLQNEKQYLRSLTIGHILRICGMSDECSNCRGKIHHAVKCESSIV